MVTSFLVKALLILHRHLRQCVSISKNTASVEHPSASLVRLKSVNAGGNESERNWKKELSGLEKLQKGFDDNTRCEKDFVGRVLPSGALKAATLVHFANCKAYLLQAIFILRVRKRKDPSFKYSLPKKGSLQDSRWHLSCWFGCYSLSLHEMVL